MHNWYYERDWLHTHTHEHTLAHALLFLTLAPNVAVVFMCEGGSEAEARWYYQYM